MDSLSVSKALNLEQNARRKAHVGPCFYAMILDFVNEAIKKVFGMYVR